VNRDKAFETYSFISQAKLRQQERECTYNVTLRRFHANIVAVEEA
jgi:uncharacterized protein YcbX